MRTRLPHRVLRALASLAACTSIFLLAVVAGVLPAGAQSSCTATVTSIADSGAGSLRQTIAAVSAATPNGKICVTATGTINLQSTLSIPQGLTITGSTLANGQNALTLSGQGQVQDVLLPANDSTSGTVGLYNLTFANSSGRGIIVGGGVQALLDQVVVQNNAGGGIDNAGTLDIENSSITGNTTTNVTSGQGVGAGIFNEIGATLTCNNCVVSGNNSASYVGGGLDNEGVATITGGSFSNNAGQQGAAICSGINSNDQGAILNVGPSVLNGNAVPGSGTSFQNNAAVGFGGGGAIYNATNFDNSGQNTNLANQATIVGATFSGNSTKVQDSGTTNGGALYNGDIMVVRESTFSANTADGEGGGIFNQGQMTLEQDTVSGNTAAGAGSGVGVSSFPEELPINTVFGNTIVAGNVTDDCSGCGTPAAGNLIGGNAMLGVLAQNGGQIATFMPLPGSSAISGGVYNANGLDSTDERGLSRIMVNGNTVSVDVGAVQTHYSSVKFSAQPTTTLAGQVITPAVQVQVIEQDGSTTNYPQGVPVTMELIPTVGMQPEGSLGGTTVISPTVNGSTTSAIFNNLFVSAAGSWELQATTYPTTQNGQIATYSAISNAFQTTSPTPPQVTWAPAAIPYGTPLPASELDATVSIGGGAATACGSSCTYNFVSGGAVTPGTTYPANSYAVQVVYTGANGQTVTQPATLVVSKATPVITVITPPAILPGAALSVANVHATAAAPGGGQIPGTFTYTPALGSIFDPGSRTVSVQFTPSDSSDYATASGSATLTALSPTASSTTLTVTPSTAYAGTAETLALQVMPQSGIPGVVSGETFITGGPSSLGPFALTLASSETFSLGNASTGFANYIQPIAYTADLNGDGVADQVITDINQLQVLFANPASPGNYLNQVVLTTLAQCAYVTSVAMGDVNNDGLADITAACVNNTSSSVGTIMLFLNQGNGSFAAATDVGGQGATPMQGANIVLGDFDGDGKLDLVSLGPNCPNGAASCFVFQKGNGDGTFGGASYTEIDAGSANDSFGSLQALDINGDGAADLAFIYYNDGYIGTTAQIWISNATDPVTFGENTGGNDCASQTCYDTNATVSVGPSSNTPSFMVLKDINGDGLPDLVAVTADSSDGSANTLSIALNASGSGVVNFPNLTADTVYAGAQSLAIADFNQDGFADAAIYSSTTNQMAVLAGNNSGAFTASQPSLTIAVNPPYVEPIESRPRPTGLKAHPNYNGATPSLYPVFSVGDANGDGFPDILFAQYGTGDSETLTGQIGINSAATQASVSTTAPASTATYTATTTPTSKLWSASTGAATLTVTQNTVALTWLPGTIPYGADIPLNATATVNGVAATGSFVYTFVSSGATIDPATVYAAGVYAVQLVFTPTGSTEQYIEQTSVTIQQATTTLTLVVPGTLLPDVKLSTANVHAVAADANGVPVAGTFSYTPALGTVEAAGAQTVTVNFTPASANYAAPAAASAPFTVLAALPTTTSLVANPASVLPGAAAVLTANVAPASGVPGSVPGTVAISSPAGTIASPRLTLDPANAAFALTPAQPTSSNTYDYNIYSADFNGDGVADLLSVPVDGNAPTLLLSPVGSASGLQAATTLSLGSTCSDGSVIGTAIGDANGDGLPDIAVACNNFDSTTTTLVVLINQGGGAFTPTVGPTLANEYSAQLVFGDFNGDGLQDLVLLTNCSIQAPSPCLELFTGNGTGTFTEATNETVANGGASDQFSNLLAGDFNKDGKLDIAFLHFSNAAPYGAVEIWKNNGGTAPTFGTAVATGTYSADKTITAGNGSATMSSLISADFNVDGLPDLALVTTVTNPNGSDAYSSRSVALNTSSAGALNFPSATADVATGGAQTSIAAADFDGDGIPDLAFYNSGDNTVRVLHGAGDGTFAFIASNFFVTVGPPIGLDVAKAPSAGRQAGKSSSPRPGDSEYGGVEYPVFAVGDVNGDGYPDLLVGQLSNSTSGLFAQQFVTNGPSLGSTAITAPAASTPYTAVSSPFSSYWAGSTGTTTLGITSLPTTTSLAVTPTAPVYGTPVKLTSQVLNTGTQTPVTLGNVTFTVDGAAQQGGMVTVDSTGTATFTIPLLTAGTHTFGATYSGATGEAASTATAASVTVAKFTPTLSWPQPPQITTTTTLTSLELDATAIGLPGTTLALPGTAVYTPPAGSYLPLGTDTLSVVFTPTDTTDYNTATKSVQITVVQGQTQTALTVSPANPVYGQALTLSAVVSDVGSSIFPAGTVTFTAGTVTLGTATLVNGAASLPNVHLNAGSQQLVATYNGAGGATSSGEQTVTIAKATPTLTWATPAPITTTTALSSTQLDASAVGLNGVNLGTGFVYTPGVGATLPAGSDTLSVTFTPNDPTNYTTATTTVMIQVTATGTRTALAVSPAAPVYGQPLTLTAQVSNVTGTTPVTSGLVTFVADSGAPSSVPVTNGVATLTGVSLGAGTHTLVATYVGTSGEMGSSTTSSVSIAKATPTLSWPAPASISTTTPLSGEQLDATAAGVVASTTGLAGSFVYTPAAGTFLTAGAHTLSVTFTPTDATDYSTNTTTVPITVVTSNTQTALTISPAAPVYGQTPLTLSAQVTNTGSTAVIQTGSVVFTSDNVTLATVTVTNGAASVGGIALGGGLHQISAAYTGAAGEGISSASHPVTVGKATPTVSWPTPAAITSTTALSSTQLDAAAAGVAGASLPGTFAYTPAAGTLLSVGAHTLSATFTPTDATDYSTATGQVSIQVVAETITLTSVSPATTTIGTAPLAIVLTGSGFPAGSVVRLNGTALATTAISATELGATVPVASLSKAGALSFTIYDASSQAISNAVTLTVTAPTPVATVTAPATVASGDQPSIALSLANAYPVDLAGTFTLTFTPSGTNGIDDPAVQFSTGGRTLDFTIPAGETAPPPALVNAGTVEGTISIATLLTAGGTDVTPPDLSTPLAITITPEAPTIKTVTFSNVNGLMTVVITGYSNTREMTQGQFIFTGPGVVDLANGEVTVPATGLFGTWYSDPTSTTFGSTFLYTQTFQLSDPTTNITGVSVTLTNTVGTSASVNSQ